MVSDLKLWLCNFSLLVVVGFLQSLDLCLSIYQTGLVITSLSWVIERMKEFLFLFKCKVLQFVTALCAGTGLGSSVMCAVLKASSS